jgi:hypothetical protein
MKDVEESNNEIDPKIWESFMQDFKRRPWKYMSLLDIDPEIKEALKPGKQLKRGWVYGYVVIIVGITLYFVSGEKWGLLNWRWWVVILMAVLGIYAGLWTAENQ